METRTFIFTLEENIYPILGDAGGIMHIQSLFGHEQSYKMVFVKPKVKFTPNAVKISN